MPIYREKASEASAVDCLLVKLNKECIEFVKSDSDRCSMFLNVSKKRIDECDVDYYLQLSREIIDRGYRSVGIEYDSSEAGFFLSLKMRDAFVDAMFMNSMLMDKDYDLDIIFLEKEVPKDNLLLQYRQCIALANANRKNEVDFIVHTERIDNVTLEECKKNNRDFVDTMLFWIDKKKISKDSIVYKRANMTAQTYNKILNRVRYPSFEKTVQLAIGLGLSKEEAIDFVSRAGFAFKPWDGREQFLLSTIGGKDLSVVDVNDQLYCKGYDTLSIRGEEEKEGKKTSGRSR